jgi:hypothetical protein
MTSTSFYISFDLGLASFISGGTFNTFKIIAKELV